MSAYDMENRIRNAFAAETPDVLDRILKNAEKGRGRKLDPDLSVKTGAVNLFYFRRAALLAAAVVLVAAAVLGASVWRSARVFSTVTFDTDISLTLQLNKDNKALSVRPNGHGASAAASLLDVEGEDADEAVADVIGALLETESLNDTENTVLIAAASEERIRGGELLDAAVAATLDAFEENDFEGAVLRVAGGGTVDEKAKLTAGKRAVVNAVASADESQSQQELMKLSATELALLSRYAGVDDPSVTVIGEVSGAGLISAEKALQTALDTLGETAGDRTEVRLTALDGALVYRLRLIFGELTYSYILSGESGDILEVIRSDRGTDIVLVRKTPEQTLPRSNSSVVSSNGGVNNAPSNTPVLSATETPADATGTPAVMPATALTDESAVSSGSNTAETPDDGSGQLQPVSEPDTGGDTPPVVTDAPAEAPTEGIPGETTGAEEPELPAIFTAKDFLAGSFTLDSLWTDGVDETPLAFSVVKTGTNLYFDQTNYPYAAAYTPDAQAVLVCNRDQLYSLLHSGDADFDDAFFEENALIVLLVQHTRKTYSAGVTELYRIGEKLTPVIDGTGTGVPGIADEAVSVYSLMFSVKKSDIAGVTSLVVPGYASGYELAVRTTE